jgi:hypothetical protein
MEGIVLWLSNSLRSMLRHIQAFYHLLHQSAIEFNNDNALKFSASLSYYTLFSLAPMLIIVMPTPCLLKKKKLLRSTQPLVWPWKTEHKLQAY